MRPDCLYNIVSQLGIKYPGINIHIFDDSKKDYIVKDHIINSIDIFKDTILTDKKYSEIVKKILDHFTIQKYNFHYTYLEGEEYNYNLKKINNKINKELERVFVDSTKRNKFLDQVKNIFPGNDLGLSFGRNYNIKNIKTIYTCILDDDTLLTEKSDLVKWFNF